MTPTGSRRIIEVWPAMYSPVERPSSSRAAPAKNRIWSTIGGISSDRVSAIGLPVFWLSISTSSSAWLSSTSAIASMAFCRSDGVVSRQPSKASAAAAYARSTSFVRGQGRGPEDRAGGGVDQVGGAAVDRVDRLAVHEVAQDALVAHAVLLTDGPSTPSRDRRLHRQ